MLTGNWLPDRRVLISIALSMIIIGLMEVSLLLFKAVIWHRVKNYTLTWVCASFLLAWLLAFQNGSAPW